MPSIVLMGANEWRYLARIGDAGRAGLHFGEFRGWTRRVKEEERVAELVAIGLIEVVQVTEQDEQGPRYTLTPAGRYARTHGEYQIAAHPSAGEPPAKAIPPDAEQRKAG